MNMKDELKSNSITTRNEKKQLEKVVTGSVKIKKKSEIRKLADAFLPEDLNAAKEHLIFEVAIPYLKNGIMDAVETLLYGSAKRRKKEGIFGSRIDYSGFSSDIGKRVNSTKSVTHNRGLNDLDRITFDRLSDARAVLGKLDDIISQFGMASVGDLYELADISTDNYAVNNYGWTDLRSAEVLFSRDGYYIHFPRIELLTK